MSLEFELSALEVGLYRTVHEDSQKKIVATTPVIPEFRNWGIVMPYEFSEGILLYSMHVGRAVSFVAEGEKERIVFKPDGPLSVRQRDIATVLFTHFRKCAQLLAAAENEQHRTRRAYEDLLSPFKS